jgi:exopolyphosphatase/guanosine-5'-triphosphate,3'-diphosphate pyrophosphatase
VDDVEEVASAVDHLSGLTPDLLAPNPLPSLRRVWPRVGLLRCHLAWKVQPLRLAVLDVGSNTVHLVVVDGQPDGTFVPVARERETLRLAEAASPRCCCLSVRSSASPTRWPGCACGPDELHADAVVGFATSAIREARNGVEALGQVREATGVAITVLPGVQEARLTYLAARRWTALSARRLLVVDIGGGSLEVAAGEADRPELAESLPLGATRLSRRFVRSDPVHPEELVALRVHALGLLGPLAERIRAHDYEVACATSKTFRNLGHLARVLPEVPTPPHAFGFAGGLPGLGALDLLDPILEQPPRQRPGRRSDGHQTVTRRWDHIRDHAHSVAALLRACARIVAARRASIHQPARRRSGVPRHRHHH